MEVDDATSFIPPPPVVVVVIVVPRLSSDMSRLASSSSVRNFEISSVARTNSDSARSNRRNTSSSRRASSRTTTAFGAGSTPQPSILSKTSFDDANGVPTFGADPSTSTEAFLQKYRQVMEKKLASIDEKLEELEAKEGNASSDS